MLLSELYKLLHIEYFGKDIYFNNIVTNSNEITNGDLFLCINSGYKYIDDAIKKGCTGVIINNDINIDKDIIVIKVSDTIKVLGLIAQYKRDNYSGIVIAITGSMGKTTTKELLCHVLKKYNNILMSTGSNNNHIGIPNTLLKLNNNYNYCILELGSNHRGEIKYLTSIVKPNISIITNIGYSHIGNFKNINNIIKEKLDIRYNTLFVNGEDKYLNKIDCYKVYKSDYDYVPKIEAYTMNYYLVIRVLEYIGFRLDTIYDELDSFINIESRMNIINKKIDIIDDAYNASYESILSGLEYIKKYKRQIIVLSDIKEVGRYSKLLHKNILKYINDNFDNYILITIGDGWNKLNNNHYKDKKEILDYLNNIKYKKGDVIYIKGAHSYNLSSLVKDIEFI